jgi:hypothetical protein
MSFVAMGVAAIGTGLSVGGGIISRNSALKNAGAQAAARNAVLADNIQKQQGFYDTNKGVFDTNIGGYSAPAQQQQLQTAQDARATANTGNQVAPDTAGVPMAAGASPAAKSDLAKRMLTTFNLATDRAKNMGRLGGYGDTWLQNELRNRQADRDIGVTNTFAEGRKSLLGPEQDMAAAAAYKPPSIWGPILSGAGSIMSGAGGAAIGRGFNVSPTPTPSWNSSNTFLQQQPTDI